VQLGPQHPKDHKVENCEGLRELPLSSTRIDAIQSGCPDLSDLNCLSLFSLVADAGCGLQSSAGGSEPTDIGSSACPD